MESYRGSSMAQEVKYCCQDKKYFSELCPTCVRAMTTFIPDDADYHPKRIDDFAIEWPEINYNSRCECGSDKTGGPGHSHWCPKHE